MCILPYIVLLLLWRFRHVPWISSLQTVAGTAPTPFSRSYLPQWLLATAAALALLAWKAPSLTVSGRAPRPAVTTLAILLDASGSMDASDWPEDKQLPAAVRTEDVPPSRLTVAKEQIRQLLTDCPDCRPALIAFADNAVLVTPAANSKDILLKRLDILHTGMFSDGTAIGQAIKAAVRALEYAPEDGPRAIVLFSDGVDHTEQSQSFPDTAALEAKENGIPLFAVGIGGKQALHPVQSENGIRWEPVGEPLDMTQLTRLAKLTGGTAFHAQDGRELANAVSAIQSRLTRNSIEYPMKRKLFLTPWLMLSALLFCIAAIITERRAIP